MAPRLHAVTFGAYDVDRLAHFWAELLGREAVADRGGSLLAGDRAQLGLRFVEDAAEKAAGLNRMHLHLTSARAGDQQATVDRALALGASHLDVGQRPEEPHVVLADPEGNEFCVIPAGNAYLEGCGFLGELACDGTREVGLFWSAALEWPLVWDQDEETAIQSPYGGTKVAWGGPPVAPKAGPNRQRLELVAGTLSTEVDRLVSLGAAVLAAADDGGFELADPDGNEFWLRPG